MAKKATKKTAATTPVRNAAQRSETKAVEMNTAAAPVQSTANERKAVKKDAVTTPVQSEKRCTEAKVEVYLQFGDKEVKVDEIMQAAREDFHDKENQTSIQSVRLYLKPEDCAAYYVANGNYSGKVAM